VTCAACQHFAVRPDAQPDGHCGRYVTETWARIPFQCGGFEPADCKLEHRRKKLETGLRDYPERRVATDVADAPLRPGPGTPVSVVIAVRTGAGVISGELLVPRERFDAALFLRALSQTAEAAG
jgi:hypothetical protein